MNGLCGAQCYFSCAFLVLVVVVVLSYAILAQLFLVY